MAVPTLLNVVLAPVPAARAPTMMPTAIKAAISAYSSAVTPSSDLWSFETILLNGFFILLVTLLTYVVSLCILNVLRC